MAQINKRKRCYAEFSEQSEQTTSSSLSLDDLDLTLSPALSAKLRKQVENPACVDDLDVCVRRVISFIEQNLLRLPIVPAEFTRIVAQLCQYTTQLDMSIVFYQLVLNGLVKACESAPDSYVVPEVLRPWHEVVIWVPDNSSLAATPLSDDFRRGFVSCYDFLRTQAKPGIPFTLNQLMSVLTPHCQIQHGCDVETVIEALMRREVIWLEETEPDLIRKIGSAMSIRYNSSALKLRTVAPFVHFDCKESPAIVVQ